MIQRADIVVAGAGHNGLITACYLAKAGHRVLVLDARPIPGGGTATEEPMLPGYRVDTCSTGHTLIHANPLMTRDELGLLSEYGLRYVDPDPVAHVTFPDGETFTQWLDVDATLDEIGRFSKNDAHSFRRMIDEWDGVKHIFGRRNFQPVGFGRPLEEELDEHPQGDIWMRRRLLSAWDIIRYEFESRHVRSFMLWQAYQTIVRPDAAGSGLNAYSIVCARQRRSWTIPLGGSGMLTDALVRCLESHGGAVHCGRKVSRLVLEDGRCVGVETEDGDQYLADTAVVSSVHVKHLTEMAPRDAWDESWRYGIETLDLGGSGFGVYLAASAAPEFEIAGERRGVVAAGVVGWPEDVIRFGRDVSDGRWSDEVAWALFATPTVVDPGRTPHPGHHTIKLMHMTGHRLPNGDTWAEAKERRRRTLLAELRRASPGFTEDHVLATMVKGPYDYEAANPHMIRGTFHGGDRSLAFSGSLQPAPGWAQHRTPIKGLYQTGSCTHPGGSITGAPGRNAAMIMLRDLGADLDEVVRA